MYELLSRYDRTGLIVYMLCQAQRTMTGRLSMSDSYQYNRIFIIGAKHCASADIREAFEKFGEITDVYIPRAKTNENKGKFCGCFGRIFFSSLLSVLV